jgi:hypothetical protein
LHISFLRQARRNEVAAIKLLGKISGSGDSTGEKDLPKQTDFHSGKQVLNMRFDAITSRIKQLPGINKHIHFDSSDDEVAGDTSSEGDAVDQSESDDSCHIVGSKGADKRVSKCPYPSTSEEIQRLGLKSEPNKKSAIESSKVKASENSTCKKDLRKHTHFHSGKKRKYQENGTPSSSCKQPTKRQKVQMQKKEVSPNCFLSTGKLEKFITTWKEACREHPVQQVCLLVSLFSRNECLLTLATYPVYVFLRKKQGALIWWLLSNRVSLLPPTPFPSLYHLFLILVFDVFCIQFPSS